MGFEIRVDLLNPGQYFAACGLFELAFRRTGEASARFEGDRFLVEADCTLASLLADWVCTPVVQTDLDDETASPFELGEPFDLRVDWWKDTQSGGRELKVWAGQMNSVRIMQSMVASLRDPSLHTSSILDYGTIVYDSSDPTSKVEPFYFDARRAPNADARDLGFSANDLGLTTTAHPAVEALCMIGLQRFRPREHKRLIYDYVVWAESLPIQIAPAVVCGAVVLPNTRRFRFESWFRTSKRMTKAFRQAAAITEGE